MATTKKILVPAIADDTKHSHLLEVVSETATMTLSVEDKRALDKSLSPVTFALRKHRLYRQGNAAVEAVRSFVIHRPKKFLQQYRNTHWLNRQRLSCSGECEGDSIELGFALALLLRTKSLSRGIIATGKLGGKEGNVTVESVGCLPEKLRLVLDARQKDDLSRSRYWFFTPEFYGEGKQLLKVANLSEVGELAALNVKVVPIRSLSEAVDKLGFLPSWLVNKLLWLASFLLLLAVAVYFSLNQPIELAFQAGDSNFGKQPFLACQKKGSKFVKLHEFEKDGNENIAPIPVAEAEDWNILLAWSIKLPEEQGVNQLLPESLQGYYLTYINVGEKTNLDAHYQEPNRLKKGDVIPMDWQLEEPAQEQDNLFMTLVTRHKLDWVELEAGFKRNFPENHLVNLNSAESYLGQYAVSKLSFYYRDTAVESFCVR